MKRKLNTENIIIIIFICFFFIPQILYFLVGSFINTSDTSENRKLAEKPVFTIKNLKNYGKEYNSYFNDHLPFRKYINISWANLNYHLLNDSPSQANVMIGKSDDRREDSWLFYKNEADHSPIKEAQGIDYSLLDQVDDSKKTMKENTEYLKNKNAKLYYLVAPNKENIYKEYLPSNVKIYRDDDVDVFSDKLKDVDNYIYLKEPLMEAKKKDQLYYKEDTHWNNIGAFYGYKAIMERLNPNTTIENYKFEYGNKISSSWDLVKMSNLYGKLKDYAPNVNYLSNIKPTHEAVTLANGSVVDRYTNDKAKINKTIAIIGDSYRSALAPILAKSYKTVIAIHRDHFDKADIDNLKADIIMLEFVERYAFLIPRYHLEPGK